MKKICSLSSRGRYNDSDDNGNGDDNSNNDNTEGDSNTREREDRLSLHLHYNWYKCGLTSNTKRIRTQHYVILFLDFGNTYLLTPLNIAHLGYQHGYTFILTVMLSIWDINNVFGFTRFSSPSRIYSMSPE